MDRHKEDRVRSLTRLAETEKKIVMDAIAGVKRG